MKTKSKKGFSLVELLVVITIIAILSVTAYVALGGQTSKARNSKRMQDIATIQQALEVYLIQNPTGQYPTALNIMGKNIISEIPMDPDKTNDYFYIRGELAGADGDSEKTYVLAATLEETDTDAKAAYVVTNDDDFAVSFDGCTATEALDNLTTCFPY